MDTPTPAAPAATTEPRRAALAFIYVSVVLDVLAFGVIIPVLPQLIVGFVGDTARGAEIFGIFATVWAVMQFFASPVLGSLSDRFGRRPVLITSAFGLAFDFILMAVAPTLALLFVGRVISGVTAASYPTAAAYISDTTPPEKRAKAFGMMGAAFGLGFIVGPAMGGLLGGINPRLPFWIAAAFSMASAVYGLFVLPESLPKERRTSFSWARANPVGSLKLLRSHHELFGLATATFLSYLAFQVLPAVYVLYTGYRYGWGPTQVGLAMTLVGVCNAVVQGALTGPAVKKLGERRALYFGLLFGVIAFMVWGWAPNGWWSLAAIVVYAPLGITGPAIQTLMTKRVSPSEQGQLQGANAAVMGLTGIIGPGLFTWIFAYFIGNASGLGLPGAPFYLSAVLMLLSAAVAARATRPRAHLDVPTPATPLPAPAR